MKKTIRFDENGKPDDIVIKCDEVHIERLNDNLWWIGAFKGGKHITMNLISECKVDIVLIEEEIRN